MCLILLWLMLPSSVIRSSCPPPASSLSQVYPRRRRPPPLLELYCCRPAHFTFIDSPHWRVPSVLCVELLAGRCAWSPIKVQINRIPPVRSSSSIPMQNGQRQKNSPVPPTLNLRNPSSCWLLWLLWWVVWIDSSSSSSISFCVV